MKYQYKFLLVITLLTPVSTLAESPGHIECEKAFKRLSKGEVLSVPEIEDWGSDKEYYFSWSLNKGSRPIAVKGDQYKTGSCTIDKRTGKGFVSLHSKDLGAFKATLPK